MFELGAVHHITRRCAGRRYRLQPTKQCISLFVYCLARAAKRYGLRVLHIVIMSNHYHLVVIDDAGNLPMFLSWTHRMITLGLQRMHRITGCVFEPRKVTGDQIITTPEGFWKAMRYGASNPVTAGIVAQPQDWPGLLTPAGVKTLHATRPSWMRKQSGPAELTLEVAMPPAELGAIDSEDEEAYHAVRAVHEREAAEEACLQRRARGVHCFLGAAKALAQSIHNAPSNQARSDAYAGDAHAEDAHDAPETAITHASPTHHGVSHRSTHTARRHRIMRRHRQQHAAHRRAPHPSATTQTVALAVAASSVATTASSIGAARNEPAPVRSGPSPRLLAVTASGIREGKAKYKAFLLAYKDALTKHLEGLRDVVFPHGSWKMSKIFHCKTAPPGHLPCLATA